MSFSWQETFFALSISFEKECQKTEIADCIVEVFLKGGYQPCLWTSVSVMSTQDTEVVGWRWLRICAEGHCWARFSLALFIHNDEGKQVREGNGWQRKGKKRSSDGQEDDRSRRTVMTSQQRPAVWESLLLLVFMWHFTGSLFLNTEYRCGPEDNLDDVAAVLWPWLPKFISWEIREGNQWLIYEHALPKNDCPMSCWYLLVNKVVETAFY